jgi:hypothetical protein
MLKQIIKIICDVMLLDMLEPPRRFREQQILHFRAPYFTLLGHFVTEDWGTQTSS